ncbi:NAD(P)H-dependent oxidoreductase [Carnobacterium gallinarum]|uniref:NAD(P)H-dependent oxidoreductase n=1 Tax=Carnobacterium gallinarum TaxID=2749 RepID=UPI000550767F|nr:NAD(P)H-dependent oxidoreductase [Carnobacterium gallinarum]
MKTTIIFAHPWHGSYNKAILDQVTDKLEQLNKEYSVIDLYKEEFNPTLVEADLKLYSQGLSSDPLVDRYINQLKETNEVIFIFPIWWYEAPAIIKGFFDKVMLVGRMIKYNDEQTQLIPLIKIDRTTVITTSELTDDEMRNDFGNPIEHVLFKGPMNDIGMHHPKWLNRGRINLISQEERTKFLETIYDYID